MSARARRIDRDERIPGPGRSGKIAKVEPHAAVVIENILVVRIELERACVRIRSALGQMRHSHQRRLTIELPKILGMRETAFRRFALSDEKALIRGHTDTSDMSAIRPAHVHCVGSHAAAKSECLYQTVLTDMSLARQSVASESCHP